MAVLYGKKFVHGAVARSAEVQSGIRRETRALERRARQRLARVRATTPHEKISGPEHVTAIGSERAGIDGIVWMDGTNPLAIEFGHNPSGYFAPERYGRLTKAPEGLYILSGAAGMTGGRG